MAYTKANSRDKFINPQLKFSDCLELDIQTQSDKFSSLIKLSGLDRDELKKVFEGAANICEGYFGLQRKIYK